MKKVLNTLVVAGMLSVSVLSSFAYKTVDCNSDPIFSANSCNQCFLWESLSEWTSVGFLKDKWSNPSQVDKILYKEEQEMPKLKNLSPSLVEWKQVPSSNFWKYTDDFNKLYSKEEEGYILPKGKEVIWLESAKWAAYVLQKNKEAEWKNIWLLVYPISSHSVLSNGEINPDSNVHKECVLYKSTKKVVEKESQWEPKTEKKTPVKKNTEKLPKTGPEIYLLLVFAMILGFGIMKIRRKA